jgi:hypothetical protein
MPNDDVVKEAIRNYLLQVSHDQWTPPKLTDLPLRIWAGMLYDGLAYGNWPWINFGGQS